MLVKKKVPISSCYLRNRGLELNSFNQKQSILYKNVLSSIEKKGLINPLTVVADGDNYKVCVGNNRYLACKELGITEVDIVIAKSESIEDLRECYNEYQKVFKDDSPFINT